ncbi:AbiJ-related protein [Streptosporangium sandarakinum]|uniref:AbiJ-related protein n=1 Tax=Streptosporangium sandarakinum TaxID=1260955 RepID=UPI003690D42D
MTRRRLINGLVQMQIQWSGTLDEVAFLARIYDLDALPSYDSRFATAAQDIAQHRLGNLDWDDDWIFQDERFGLADGDEALLAFLAEMLHPAVRLDLSEVEQLRAFLNDNLIHDGYELVQVDAVSGAPIFAPRRIGSGVRGTMKNLIFAAIGPKPEIVLDDAVNNDLRIVRNEQGCLVYDRPLTAGLTWTELTDWWADREGLSGWSPRDVARSLYQRLDESLGDNGAERRILRTYADRYIRLGPDIPALIPQVYLHYDPYTRQRHLTGTSPLERQRMDFLLLLPHQVRIVIECDGKQHYADDDGLASPRRYATMMAGDRDLRLKGYEVYRFGGAELVESPATIRMLEAFFDRLAARYAE